MTWIQWALQLLIFQQFFEVSFWVKNKSTLNMIWQLKSIKYNRKSQPFSMRILPLNLVRIFIQLRWPFGFSGETKQWVWEFWCNEWMHPCSSTSSWLILELIEGCRTFQPQASTPALSTKNFSTPYCFRFLGSTYESFIHHIWTKFEPTSTQN